MSSVTITEQTQTAAPEAGDAQVKVTERTAAKARAIWLAPAIVLAAVAVFGFVTVLNFPVAFVDETWNANRAWDFLQTGRPFASVDSGVFQSYDGYWTYWPYLASLIQAAFIWLLGVSLASIRLASLFFGLVLLAAVYFITRKLYGQRAAVIAMALLAISGPFVLSSHLGRHDIILAAFGFGAIALYFTDGKSSLTIKSVLAGLAVGLGLDIHLNALIFGPIMLTLFLLDYGKSIFRTGRFWGFVLGGSLGVLFFVAMHILPYPQTYFALANLSNGASHSPPIFTASPDTWRLSLVSTFGLLDLLFLPVMVPAAIFLIRRQSRSDVRALALFGISILAMAAIIQNKAPFYAILIMPTVPLMVAPYLDDITQKLGSVMEWTFWRNFIVIGLVVAAGCINLAPAIRGNDAEFQKALAYVHQNIPNGSLVYGAPTYWFALQDTRYVNWDQIVMQQRAMPAGTFTGAIETLRPDYLVVDGFVAAFIWDDDQCRASYRDSVCIPKTEFNALLKEHATLAGDLNTDAYGAIRIYKMNWANTQSGAGR